MTRVKPYCFPENDGDILVLAQLSGIRENNISQLIKFRTLCNLGGGARDQGGQDTAVFKRNGSLPWRFTPMRMQSKHSYKAWGGGLHLQMSIFIEILYLDSKPIFLRKFAVVVMLAHG
jgi:hypothetical protein